MQQPKPTSCDHHYETRILGGHPVSVRICTLCQTPDWPDLYEQADVLFRWGREEGLAGKPPRERLSAYDRPRNDPAVVPVAVSPPATNQTERRDRYADPLYELMRENGWDGERTEPVVREMNLVLDAVTAVADAEQTELRTAFNNQLNLFASEYDRHQEEERRLRDAAEAYRLALSRALGLGTGANWEALRDRGRDLVAEVAELTTAVRQLNARPAPAAGLRGEAGETQQGEERPRCPHCQMPHDLTPDVAAVCASIRASIPADEAQQGEEPAEDPARIDRLRPEFTDHASVEAIDAQLRRARTQERRWHIRTEWLISLRQARVDQKARAEQPAVVAQPDKEPTPPCGHSPNHCWGCPGGCASCRCHDAGRETDRA